MSCATTASTSTLPTEFTCLDITTKAKPLLEESLALRISGKICTVV